MSAKVVNSTGVLDTETWTIACRYDIKIIPNLSAPPDVETVRDSLFAVGLHCGADALATILALFDAETVAMLRPDDFPAVIQCCEWALVESGAVA